MLTRLVAKWLERRAEAIEDRHPLSYPPASYGAEMRRLARNLRKFARGLR